MTIATKMDGFFFQFDLVSENFVINTSRHLACLILMMNLELQSGKIDATLQMCMFDGMNGFECYWMS